MAADTGNALGELPPENGLRTGKSQVVDVMSGRQRRYELQKGGRRKMKSIRFWTLIKVRTEKFNWTEPQREASDLGVKQKLKVDSHICLALLCLGVIFLKMVKPFSKK